MQEAEKTSALNAFRAAAPIDTGNLRYNSISIVDKRDVELKSGAIVKVTAISVDDKIAPYAVYTEEPWTSPKWHGRKNPNEGWVERGLENVTFALAQMLDGTIVPEEGFQEINQETFVYNVKVRRRRR